MKHTKQKSCCSEQIVLRLAPTLPDKIEHAGAAEGRSLANMTRRVLERWVAEREHGEAA